MIKLLKQIKTPILVLVAITLTIVSLIKIPTVDRIVLESDWQYPFFYASALPSIYYFAVVYLALLALFVGNDHCKLISLLSLALLVELTPSLMLVNPWLPDQYPYLEEPVYLIKTSHITPFHYLAEVPGLGLMFSHFMLITGLEPYMISKLYPVLASLTLVLPMYVLSRKLCGNGALIPLLFLAFNTAQINTFHRFSYFFMFFSSWLYLVWARATRPVAGYSISSIVLFSAAVLAYPGSVIIPIMVLAPTLIMLITRFWGGLAKGLGESARMYQLHTLDLISLCVFLSWNIHVAGLEFNRMIGNVYQALMELTTPFGPTFLLTPQHPWAEGLTPLFTAILRARMLLTATILSLGFLSSVYVFFKKKRNEALIPTMYLSLLATLAPFMFTGWGQWYMSKFVVYSTLTASACVAILWRLKRNKYLRTFILILVVVGVISVPILRYASIPYLHPTTQELKATVFVHHHYEGSGSIRYTEYPPYIRVLVGKDPSWELSGMEPAEWLGGGISHGVGYLLSHRVLTRDGYYVYQLSRQCLLDNLINSLSESHSLVYCNDPYVKLFMPTQS